MGRKTVASLAVGVFAASGIATDRGVEAAQDRVPLYALARFPWPSLCGPTGAKRWVFDNNGPGGTWALQDRNWATAGYNAWRSLLDYDRSVMVPVGDAGLPAITVVRGVPAVAEPHLTIESDAAADHNGDGWNDHRSRSNCTKMQIASPSAISLTKTATHEMGHALGLNHTGRDDLRTNAQAFDVAASRALMMSSCSGVTNVDTPSVDDWAAITAKTRPWFTVDPGFENVGTSAWGGTFTSETATPKYGQRYVSMPPGQLMFQNLRIYNGNPSNALMAGWYKTNGSGSVYWKARRRAFQATQPIDYANVCDPGLVLAWNDVLLGQSSPALTWTSYTTPTGSVGSGVDLQMQVWNGMNATLFLDNVSFSLS
jgi:hypothetical protein